VFRSFLGIVILLISGPFQTAAADYAWPMLAPPALTSTFGEYRSGRFHAGLDLKTWGREGYPVVAVDDGFIWRVRTSPWGYGKVVYVRLKDGKTAVYAHLSGFSAPIRRIVEAEQFRRGAYSVNLYLKAGQIPVMKGDVVGRSGSTGSGLPHLHFEIRDANQRPLNALTSGFQAADSIASSFRSLAFVPLGADSRVNGAWTPATLTTRRVGSSDVFKAQGDVRLEGRIGVAVDVFDRADASALSNRLAPYRLRLLVDGEEAFSTTYGALDYGRIFLANLDRSFRLYQEGLGLYHNLFRAHGNDMPIYGSYHVGDGVLHAGVVGSRRGVALRPGSHELVVEAEDVHGNRSVAQTKVTVAVEPRLQLKALARSADGDSIEAEVTVEGFSSTTFTLRMEASADDGATWSAVDSAPARSGDAARVMAAADAGRLYRVRALDGGGDGFITFAPTDGVAGPALGNALLVSFAYGTDAALLSIASDRLLAAPPMVTLDGNPGSFPVRQKGLTMYDAMVLFPLRDGVSDVVVSALDLKGNALRATARLTHYRVGPTGGRVSSADGKAEARFEVGGVYATFYGRASAEPQGEAGVVGLAYEFSPSDVPFGKAAVVALAIPEGAHRKERLGVYERRADSGWAFVGNRMDSTTGRLEADVRHFSTYALRLDVTPPEVEVSRPRRGETVEEGRPILQASASDGESGIGREEDFEMRVDDRPLIVEYNPEDDTLTARPPTSLANGDHVVEVTVRDMSGNETRARSTFSVQAKR